MISVYVCINTLYTHISAKEFKDDLTPRKSSIKLMIQNELTKLAEVVDEGEEEGEKK